VDGLDRAFANQVLEVGVHENEHEKVNQNVQEGGYNRGYEHLPHRVLGESNYEIHKNHHSLKFNRKFVRSSRPNFFGFFSAGPHSSFAGGSSSKSRKFRRGR
jgi:hypothetical protein